MEHRFGSINTQLKLEVVGKYLPAYTTALKKAPFSLHYVDAFAGTGVCHIKVRDQRIMIPGSASIALDCQPPFHQMLFIEANRRRAQALGRLVVESGRNDIVVVNEDANIVLPRHIGNLNPKRDRALVFLDPYGMSVNWATLQKLAESKIVDVWYLFPLSGLYRQATRDAADMDEDKVNAICRMMGISKENLLQELYREERQLDLLGADPRVIREANPIELVQWVKHRLQHIFPGVTEPKLLYQSRQDGMMGAPIFALFFAVSNPDSRAKGLALKIANDILKQ